MVTALFGLVQGGIVLTYTLIVREYYPAAEAGTRVGLVLSATLAGMAIGGWISGIIFDATLSYRAAFLNGFGWNLLNIAIAVMAPRCACLSHDALPSPESWKPSERLEDIRHSEMCVRLYFSSSKFCQDAIDKNKRRIIQKS